MLGVGVGVLLIAWGAVPAETKERLKQDLWERPKQELKVMGAVTVVAGVAYGGYLVLPSILGMGGPTGATMIPALAGGGTTGGGIVVQQAAVGTAKAAILTGGAYVVGRGTLDPISYSKSDSGSDKGNANERIDWDKAGRNGDKDAYNRVTVNDGTKNNKFLESKTGTGLDRINPGTGRVQQTYQQWAKEQIFDDAEKLIRSLRQAKGTGFNGLTKDAPPTIARLREIRHLEYRIQSQDSRVIKAVAEEIAKLRARFPDWKFSALHGGL